MDFSSALDVFAAGVGEFSLQAGEVGTLVEAPGEFGRDWLTGDGLALAVEFKAAVDASPAAREILVERLRKEAHGQGRAAHLALRRVPHEQTDQDGEGNHR